MHPTAPDPAAHMIDDLADELSYLAVSPEEVRKKLLQTRNIDVPAYLDALVDTFPWEEMAVVGFTSTFQQNTASFALARRLKQHHPHLVTVFGGANFDSEMGPELVRTIDCIDVAVIGEGDKTFPRLLRALAADTDLDVVPGLARRLDGHVGITPPLSPTVRLDDLPTPDYEEYFQHAEDLVLQQHFVRYGMSSPVVAGPGAVLVAPAPAGPGPCGGPAGGCGDQVCQETADLAECDRDEAAARAFGAIAAVTDRYACASMAKVMCRYQAS